jgi:hypothetical protein
MESEREHINLALDPALLKRIDDFRFKKRFRSRTAAIAWLLEWALKQKPDVQKGENK